MKINTTSIKKLFSVSILAAFLVVSFSCCSTPENNTPSKTLEDYPEISIPDSNVEDFVTNVSSVQMAKNMIIGWNLGNTLDAHYTGASGIGTETSWGMPKTT